MPTDASTSIAEILPNGSVRVSGGAGHYRSQESLVDRFVGEELTDEDVKERIEKIKNSPSSSTGASYKGKGEFEANLGSGYYRFNISNLLFKRTNGNLVWDYESFLNEISVDNDIDINLPLQIADKIGPDTTKREALHIVRQYIDTNYVYASIDPSKKGNYDNILEAVMSEKKALCDSANTLAAVWLHDIGVKDVRVAHGALYGGFHRWLEVNAGTASEPDFHSFF